MSRRRSPAPRRAAEQSLEHRILLTATLCLLAGGAVMVYSASSARTLLAGQGDGTMYLVKYLSYGALGFVALHLATRVSLDWVRKITPILLAISFFLCLLVKVPGIGVEVNGATRWLGAGPLQFQPSELMKLALVLYAVHLLAAAPADRHEPARDRQPAARRGGRRGGPHRLAARPRHRARLLVRHLRAAHRGGAADAGPGDPRGQRDRRDHALRPRRAVPARAADLVPRPVGRARATPASSPSRARSRSAPAGSSAAASANRSRRSSTCPRRTRTSSSP